MVIWPTTGPTQSSGIGVHPLSSYTRLVVAVILGACATTAQAAGPPADIADLFPPGTVAYAELHNPAELSPQLAALFKGTAFEDSIPFIHNRKDAAKMPIELRKQELAGLALLTSPEMLAEFKKLRVAAGITGFTDAGDFDGVVVVLTGESPAAGLAARAYLTMDGTLRKVGEVSRVPVFQHRSPNINSDPSGQPIIAKDKPFTDGPHEPTFAYTPGLFVMGTSKTAVGHAIKRFLGEEKAGLAGTDLFKEAAAANRQTGLFYFVNFPEFAAKFNIANRARGGAMRIEDLFRMAGDTDLYAWFKMTANPKAVKSIAGCIRFRDGGIAVTLSATIDLAQKSPLLDFLSGPGLKVEMLHHARRPATLSFAVMLPEKNRGEAVIGFLDSLAKARGELGRLPGEAVREMEAKFKVSIADGLIGKTKAVTLVLPTKQELPKGAKSWPTVVLHCEDGAAAAAWEQFVPKLIGDIAGTGTPQPSSETISGVKVFSLPGTGLPTKAPVHYARSGAAFAIGLDRKLVAASVTADPSNAITSGATAVTLPADPVAAFGTLAIGEVIPSPFESPRPDGPVVPLDGVANTILLPNGQPLPEKMIEELKKARNDFFGALSSLSPATLSARRVGNELRIELYQPKVQNGGLKAIVEAGANWLDKSASLRDPNQIDRLERQVYGKW